MAEQTQPSSKGRSAITFVLITLVLVGLLFGGVQLLRMRNNDMALTPPVPEQPAENKPEDKPAETPKAPAEKPAETPATPAPNPQVTTPVTAIPSGGPSEVPATGPAENAILGALGVAGGMFALYRYRQSRALVRREAFNAH